MEDLICHIGVRLSYEDEMIRTISAGELTSEDLGELSTMLIGESASCGIRIGSLAG